MLDQVSVVQFTLCILDKIHHASTETFNLVSNARFPQRKKKKYDAHKTLLAENMGMVGHGVTDLAFITMYREIENHEKDLYALEDELVDFEGSDFDEEELSSKKRRKSNNMKRRIRNIMSNIVDIKNRRDK